MNYDDLIDMWKKDCNVGHEGRIILRDMEFMLAEFKKNRKLGIIDSSLRKELTDLVTKMCTPGARPGQLWEYGCYFRLKKRYLDMKEGKDV